MGENTTRQNSSKLQSEKCSNRGEIDALIHIHVRSISQFDKDTITRLISLTVNYVYQFRSLHPFTCKDIFQFTEISKMAMYGLIQTSINVGISHQRLNDRHFIQQIKEYFPTNLCPVPTYGIVSGVYIYLMNVTKFCIHCVLQRTNVVC